MKAGRGFLDTAFVARDSEGSDVCGYVEACEFQIQVFIHATGCGLSSDTLLRIDF